MKKETSIQNAIRIALSQRGCIVLRSNVGEFFTIDGRKVHIGVNGQSDLHGHRKDGKAFYIEVKTEHGKVRDDQKTFLKQMIDSGALAGIARSVEDALMIVFPGGKDNE